LYEQVIRLKLVNLYQGVFLKLHVIILQSIE